MKVILAITHVAELLFCDVCGHEIKTKAILDVQESNGQQCVDQAFCSDSCYEKGKRNNA